MTVGPSAAIEVTDLVISYGRRVAVDGVSFAAYPGQVLTLLGPNGAGKTSTVETLEGYRRPDKGTVRVLGLDPQADHRQLCPLIGVMLQRGGIYPAMNATDALALFASYYADPDDPGGLLDRVGLRSVARTPWRRLSGGEQQRLSLALALVGRPRVAFLDEPTAGVDPQGRRTIREVISELKQAGVCVLITTHELDEAERMADQIVIIDAGQVRASGTPGELMSSGGQDSMRFGAPAGLDTVSLGAHLGAEVSENQPGEYVVAGETKPATIAALATWLAERDLPLGDLRAGRQRLEDVFVGLTGGASSAGGGSSDSAPAYSAPEDSAPEDSAPAAPTSPAGSTGRRRGRRRSAQ